MARGRRRRAGPGWIRVAGASLVAAGGSAIGMSVSAFATTGATAPHVMVVTMENKNYSEVIGAANQPVTNALADDYGLATDSYSVAHPSLPNYIDLVSGQDPSNAADDGPPSAHTYSYPTIADQLQAAGYSTQAFAEDLPADPTNDDGEYAVRHNPWEYFPATPMNVADASTMVGDLDSTDPPDFVWYTPDMLDDEHTGEPVDSLATEEAAGESFLSSFIPEVQATTWYQQGGQIVIEWDESDTDDTNGGGHIPTIVVSAALSQSSTEVDTTGVLNSIEDVYGLPHLGEGVGTIDALLTLGTPTTTTTTTTTTPSSSTTTAPAAPTTTVAAASATTTTVPTVSATTAPTTTTPTATVSGGAGTTTTLPPAVGAAASGGAAPASSQASASASSAASDPPSADGGGTDPSVVTAASTDLAFTGAGPGVRTLTLAGAALVLVGLAALVLAGPPRRRLLAAAGREQTRRLFALQGDIGPTADPRARPGG